MSKLPIFGIVMMAGLLWPAGAAAQASEEERQRALTSNLFDEVGAPLMRISGPVYLQLGIRDKLRGQSGNGPGGGDNSRQNPGPGEQPPIDQPDKDGAVQLPDEGGPIQPPDPGGNEPPVRDQVPEPALLSLIVPGAWLALRRRAARSRSNAA